MFQNYIKLALRNLYKNKLYAGINIFGLAIGLTIYVFAVIVARYENTHDSFFPNAERIYSINAKFQPNAGPPVSMSQGVQSAVHPLLRAENPEMESMARVYAREYLTRVGDKKLYQNIHFAEPDFVDIFQFEYLQGDGNAAANDPTALIMTESAAKKFYGDENPMGKEFLIDNREVMTVRAIIKDLPVNSHLNSEVIGNLKLEIIAPIQAWVRLTGYDLTGNWNNLSTRYTNYMLLPETWKLSDLQNALDNIYETHVDEDRKDFIAGFALRNVVRQNTYIWDASGMPVLMSLQILGALILIVGCLNYTNLATAQAFGRMREVGLRKTLGASKTQLFSQFMIESVVVALLSLIISLGILELIVPMANDAMGKGISLSVLLEGDLLALMISVIVAVGLISGGYPAWVISKVQTSEIFRGETTKGKKGVLFRNIMLVIQFSISIFLMAIVAIIYLQNQKLEESAEVFPKEQTLIINRVSNAKIRPLQEVLKAQIGRLEGVEKISLMRQEPFEQSNSTSSFWVEQNKQLQEVQILHMNGDEDFFDLLDINFLSGRNFSKDNGNDLVVRDEEGVSAQTERNIILNEKSMTSLGFESPQNALGKTFTSGDKKVTYSVVGVVEDVNYMGLFNDIKPYMFSMDPVTYRVLAVKINGGMIPGTVTEIEKIWGEVVPDFPLDSRFMDDIFNDIFQIFEGINFALLVFASIAMVLAAIGLFGMAAFMAEKRTKEIGVRRVMGASVNQIITLLVWQFSKPVVWALGFGLLGAWGASYMYLNFFQDRINLTPMVFIVTGVFALAISWATVTFHAWRVAQSNPIDALRYE
jgi:putative ABC transport system permease protein